MSKIEVLNQAWTQFILKWRALAEQNGYPQIEPDSQWPSPCEFTENDKTYWKPIEQQQSASLGNDNRSFDNVGQAMDLVVDAQYAAFFSGYYADNINAEHQVGPLQFLQPWSETDFERLQQNLIGHLMMKAKLKQAATLFFALTDEDDLNLVVVNDSSEVWLEYVGKEPHKKVADNLAEFINQCTPSL